MNVEAMRKEILKMYPGPNWKHKVLNMRESQVMAVYFSMTKRGQKPIKKDKSQMTIYDYDKEGRPKR